MPIYEFITNDEEVIELFMSFAEFDRRVKNGQITLDDGRVAKSYFNSKSGISTFSGNYPMVSDAAGVHPSQIKEHMDHLRQMGCGQVNHTKDGSVIFESKGQRRKVLKALGLFDRNAGYSDPTPDRLTSVRRYR